MLVGSTIGPFVIDKELGSGAMGTVYRARFQKGEDQTVDVAFKVIGMGLLGNESALARFEREANILKQLRHPNIVRLLATGRYRQTPFIAMEFIDGEAMDGILARRGRFSWEEVVAFGKQLCAALQHAHEKGIIHRDLKPSNLMLTRDGVLKLTDFGIAKDTDVTALTGANSTIGTAAYMSPEQCRGERDLTNKSDLYSLGIVFFELLTGKKPFTAESTVDMFLKHVNEPPPRIGKLVPEIPAKLDALIMQLMEKEKDDRPVDAAWVARMLEEIEEDAFARQSVGLDVAAGRSISRKAAEQKGMDETDREVARAIKGKKKRRRKGEEREVRSRRYQALGLIAGLVAILAVLYWAFRPASQESLFNAVKNAVDDESALTAADKYLAAYGQRPGEMTDFVQNLAREKRVKKRDEVLTRRFEKNFEKPDERDDPEAYRTAWLAMLAEKEGDLKRASDLWKSLGEKFAKEGALPEPLSEDMRARAMWAWLAAKRLKDIEQAARLAKELELRLKEEWINERFTSYAPTDPRSLAVKALRLEAVNDKPKARMTWDSLVAQTEGKVDQHEWFLLASQRRRLIPPMKEDEALSQRLVLLSSKLDAARQAAVQRDDAVQMRLARNHCREILDLYDGEADDRIRQYVKEARALLDSLPRAN